MSKALPGGSGILLDYHTCVYTCTLESFTDIYRVHNLRQSYIITMYAAFNRHSVIRVHNQTTSYSVHILSQIKKIGVQRSRTLSFRFYGQSFWFIARSGSSLNPSWWLLEASLFITYNSMTVLDRTNNILGNFCILKS